MAEFACYKALKTFSSKDNSILNIEKDDVLQILVESLFSKSLHGEEGWLYAFNQRTDEWGYVLGMLQNFILLKHFPNIIPYSGTC